MPMLLLREICRLCACSSGYMVTYTKHNWTDIDSLQVDEREVLDYGPSPSLPEHLAPAPSCVTSLELGPTQKTHFIHAGASPLDHNSHFHVKADPAGWRFRMATFPW